jgi:hypothetical protein
MLSLGSPAEGKYAYESRGVRSSAGSSSFFQGGPALSLSKGAAPCRVAGVVLPVSKHCVTVPTQILV